jgi:hypothetical protein
MRNKRKGMRIPKNPAILPMYNSTCIVRRTIRYTLSAGSAVVVAGSDLVAAGGGVTTILNNSLRLFCLAAKLHRLRVWSQPVTSSTPAFGNTVTVVLTWGPVVGNAFYNAARTQITAQSVGPEEPVHIDSRPYGPSAQWVQTGQSDRLFSLWGSNSAGAVATGIPEGTIVEIDASFILSDGSVNGANYPITAGGTLGLVMYPPLDGSTTRFLMPVGLQVAV